jgi:4-amino-4-deoxy-L-arabinose transferase-like glycosyltransferase
MDPGVRAGFYAALLAVSGWFGLDLVSGHAVTHHNDVALLFYVAASLWAWAEMSRARTVRWAVLVGVFAGLAVLVKWLTGLLVFSGWAIAVVTDQHLRPDSHSWGRIVLELAVAAAVVLPWQISILKTFPEEGRWEYALNTRHLYAKDARRAFILLPESCIPRR